MSTAGLYYKVVFTVCLVVVVRASCKNQISCPCGATRRTFYYTHCFDKEVDGDLTCERWAKCETCRANVTHCVTCPLWWTGPACDEVKIKANCPDPGIPEGALRFNENGTEDATERLFSEGESLYFSCKDSDSVPKGNTIITCTRLSIWSDSLPRCEKDVTVSEIKEICPDPGVPEGTTRRSINGTDETASRDFLEGESLYFYCNDEDSELDGANVINCTQFGFWDDGAPRCKRIEIASNGTICPDPGIPDGSSRENYDGYEEKSKRSFREGEMLFFYCDEDFELIGEYTINCTSSGNWSSSLPRCQKTEDEEYDPLIIASNGTTCPDPGIPDGGSRENYEGKDENSQRSFRDGEMLFFYCDDEDSEIIGEYKINCTSSGNWSSSMPRCQKTEEKEGEKEETQPCPDPGIPEGGGRRNSEGTEDVTERIFQEGESVHYYCKDEDFVLVGAQVINCTTFGTWSHSQPWCEKTVKKESCPDPGTPEGGGRRIFEGAEVSKEPIFVEGVSVYFYCNDTLGYSIKGDSIIVCTPFGNWSQVPPLCEQAAESTICRDPGISEGLTRRTADGTVVDVERDFQDGESVHFSCIEADAILQGDDVIFCTSIGTWSGSLPRCQKTETAPSTVTIKSLSCPDPGIPVGGSRQNAAGTEVLEERPFAEGESLYFLCKEEDSELKGDYHITCTSNGWSGLLPQCEKAGAESKPAIGKPCKHPGDIANGLIENLEVIVSSVEKQQVFPSATRLSFQCKEGFKLEGQSVLFCLCSGEWTSEPPTCVSETIGPNGSPSIHCKNRGSISNGQVNTNREIDSSNEEYRPFYSVGTRLHYNCNSGYILKGARTVLCESSGSWSAKEPKCIRDGGLPEEDEGEDEEEEPVRPRHARRGSGKPNSLTFKFFFY